MANDETALTVSPPASGLQTAGSFELLQRIAVCLSKSELVPACYRGERGLPNAFIAIELANRMGLSPMMVMQNLHVIKGKPSWSATFTIAAINSLRRFSPLKFRMTGERGKDTWGCIATARYLATGDDIDGPEVTIGLARAEGWLGREGTKWKTMPELMLRYRAATFFGRLYAPEALMGIRPLDEFEDIAAAEAARIAEQRRTGNVVNPAGSAAPPGAVNGNGHAPHAPHAPPPPPGGAMISIDQWDAIKAALRDNQTPQTRLLEHLRVSRPGAIPASHFDEALSLAKRPVTAWTQQKPPEPAYGAGHVTDEQLERLRTHLDRTGLAGDEEWLRRVLEPYHAESIEGLLGFQAEMVLVELRDIADAPAEARE